MRRKLLKITFNVAWQTLGIAYVLTLLTSSITWLLLPKGMINFTWLAWLQAIRNDFSGTVFSALFFCCYLLGTGVLIWRGGLYRVIGEKMGEVLAGFSISLVIASLITALLLKSPIDALLLIHFLQYPPTAHIQHIAFAIWLLSIAAMIFFMVALIFSSLNSAKKALGDARFASGWNIYRAGLFAKRGIMLGKAYGSALKLASFESVLVTAPTGSGKTSAIAIPNLFAWEGSVIANDLKGELFHLTANYRRDTLQNKIYCFAPTRLDKKTHHYNPLFFVRRHADLMLRDLQLIAEVLIPAERIDGGFWYTSARDLFILLAIYLLETKQEATLADIHDIAKQENFFGWLRFRTEEKYIQNKVFYQNANSLLSADAERTQKNILKDFHSRLTLFSDPLIRQATSQNDIDVRLLRQEKLSIYLHIPDSDKERLKPIITLFWAQCIHHLTQTLPDINKEPYSILALLDEFGNMARINQLKEGLSFLRSYRVCAIILVQYLSQIISTYGTHDARGFLNAKIKMAFALSDNEDAKFFAEILGKITVKISSSSRTSGEQHASSSTATHYQARPLLTSDELMRLKKDEAIIVVEGAKPIKAKKCFWFKENVYKILCRKIISILYKIYRIIFLLLLRYSRVNNKQ